jgi:hypothetical protein
MAVSSSAGHSADVEGGGSPPDPSPPAAHLPYTDIPFSGTIRFYGQAPGKSVPPGWPAFLGNKTIVQLAGIPENELRWLIKFENLLPEYPGHQLNGKGDHWPKELAERRADEALQDWKQGDAIVFAGRNVLSAFGLPSNWSWFEWHGIAIGVHGPTDIVAGALFPHPSRVSRYWNDPVNCRRAEQFMRGLVELGRSMR